MDHTHQANQHDPRSSCDRDGCKPTDELARDLLIGPKGVLNLSLGIIRLFVRMLGRRVRRWEIYVEKL